MIAEYKGNKYYYNTSSRRSELVTSDSRKADGSFQKDGDLYFKPIEEKDLGSIFTVEFFAGYDSGLEGTDRSWHIIDENDVIKDGKVRLTFAKGILPGWDMIDKNVCEKYVSLDDITSFTEKITYKKCNGTVPDKPKVVIKQINRREIEKELNKYNENFL